MSKIGSIDNLVEIAKERNGQSMELMMPVQYKVKDGFLHVLPGDDLYPKNPNYNESGHDLEEYSEKTTDEMRANAKNLFRGEIHEVFDMKFVCNVTPSDGHISFDSNPISKL